MGRLVRPRSTVGLPPVCVGCWVQTVTFLESLVQQLGPQETRYTLGGTWTGSAGT